MSSSAILYSSQQHTTLDDASRVTSTPGGSFLEVPSGLDLRVEAVPFLDGVAQGCLLVVVPTGFDVGQHRAEQVGPFHLCPRRFEAQHGEVNVQMVVRWLVVEVRPEPLSWYTKLVPQRILWKAEGVRVGRAEKSLVEGASNS